MPKSEKDLKSGEGYMKILFMAPPKSGKTTCAILTAPRPIYVLNSDEGGLSGQPKLGGKFEFDDIHTWIEAKKYVEYAKKETGPGVKNAYRTVVVDSITFMLRGVHAELEGEGRKGFELYQELERRGESFIRNVLRLQAHTIFIAHALEGTSASGSMGIMPAVKGVLKTLLPAMVNDMLWMDVVTPKDGKGEVKREFLLGPSGDWTHGMRSLHGGGTMEANFTKLCQRMEIKP